MSLLEVRNLSYSYNKKQKALTKINFSINHHGIIGILGANGAGKSTLMNLICGLLLPKEGTILIQDNAINKSRLSYLNSIGFLPQQPPLYPDLTIREYLAHVADLKQIKRENAKIQVEKVMEKCGLIPLKNRLITNLSGGYQQRVGIAQAILHAPPIIILDEPTNGLDPQQIIEIRNLIKQIAQDSLVLLSTHIISEIEKMSRRILVLEKGQLIIDEPLETFRSILPNDKITINIEKDTDKALRVLRENNFTAKKTAKEQLLIINHEKKTVNEIIKLLLLHDFTIKAIAPEQTSIEDVYHFLSKHKN